MPRAIEQTIKPELFGGETRDRQQQPAGPPEEGHFRRARQVRRTLQAHIGGAAGPTNWWAGCKHTPQPGLKERGRAAAPLQLKSNRLAFPARAELLLSFVFAFASLFTTHLGHAWGKGYEIWSFVSFRAPSSSADKESVRGTSVATVSADNAEYNERINTCALCFPSSGEIHGTSRSCTPLRKRAPFGSIRVVCVDKS
jgi:hypothetical protein